MGVISNKILLRINIIWLCYILAWDGGLCYWYCRTKLQYNIWLSESRFAFLIKCTSRILGCRMDTVRKMEMRMWDVRTHIYRWWCSICVVITYWVCIIDVVYGFSLHSGVNNLHVFTHFWKMWITHCILYQTCTSV